MAARRAPYKDFLQPALQRRFVLASGLVLVIAYLEAVLVGSWRSFLWAWFPILRTFFFFLCAFSIVLLRIAHYHVGIRTTSSPLQVACGALFKAKSWEIILTYVIFGWLFGQVYLWHAGERTGLQWISYAHHSGDRARLNEKPILFATFFAMLGIVHGLFHLATDLDSLPLGIVAPSKDKEDEKEAEFSLVEAINFRLPTIITRAVTITGISLLLHLVDYVIFLRPRAWGWALLLLRPFYNLPRTNMLPSTYPYHLWLFLRMAYVGFLLSFLWIAGNIGFSLLMNAEPLKHGKPITSESKDPNGSLLNGLKSKKTPVKCFAMWELAFIARDFEDRRKAIFEDIDRKDGPMWSHVYQVCMDVIQAVQQNMDSFGKTPEEPKPAPGPVQYRPRAAIPPKADNVVIEKPKRDDMMAHVRKGITDMSQSPGQTLSPSAKKTLEDVKNKYLTKEQQEAMTAEGMESAFRTQVAKILDTKAGRLIRRDFGLRLAAAVFGGEEVEISLHVNAVNVLTKLSVNSLAEDKYGQVQRDVASIVRCFTTTIAKLDQFAAAFPGHWLDGKAERRCEQVATLASTLRMGLQEMLGAFGEYTDDLRLSRADVRLARDAVRAREEMTQVR